MQVILTMFQCIVRCGTLKKLSRVTALFSRSFHILVWSLLMRNYGTKLTKIRKLQ